MLPVVAGPSLGCIPLGCGSLVPQADTGISNRPKARRIVRGQIARISLANLLWRLSSEFPYTPAEWEFLLLGPFLTYMHPVNSIDISVYGYICKKVGLPRVRLPRCLTGEPSDSISGRATTRSTFSRLQTRSNPTDPPCPPLGSCLECFSVSRGTMQAEQTKCQACHSAAFRLNAPTPGRERTMIVGSPDIPNQQLVVPSADMAGLDLSTIDRLPPERA
ncbi:hypothetical protein F4778DRAFT_109816 [Xylariomycetidae sp. FL2044]|nr:hypothetical protein F4778DRAFT_109816 [Xylariomycetidae sp. FL2044]